MTSQKITTVVIFLIAVTVQGCSRPDAYDALSKGDNVALEAALDRGANPNSKDKAGTPLLYLAVSHGDPAAVRALLAHKADPDIKDANGQSALELAVSGVLADSPHSVYSDESKDKEDPRVEILQAIMQAKRRQAQKAVTLEGKLDVSLEAGKVNREEGIQMIAHTTIEASGKKYSLNLSRWETEYGRVDRSGDKRWWDVILRPGKLYKVVGTEKNGDIEVEALTLIVEPNGETQFEEPLGNYLPTTLDAIDKVKSTQGKSSR